MTNSTAFAGTTTPTVTSTNGSFTTTSVSVSNETTTYESTRVSTNVSGSTSPPSWSTGLSSGSTHPPSESTTKSGGEVVGLTIVQGGCVVLGLLLFLSVFIVCWRMRKVRRQRAGWKDEGYMGVSERGSPISRRKARDKDANLKVFFSNHSYEEEIAISLGNLSNRDGSRFTPVVPPEPAAVQGAMGEGQPSPAVGQASSSETITQEPVSVGDSHQGMEEPKEETDIEVRSFSELPSEASEDAVRSVGGEALSEGSCTGLPCHLPSPEGSPIKGSPDHLPSPEGSPKGSQRFIKGSTKGSPDHLPSPEGSPTGSPDRLASPALPPNEDDQGEATDPSQSSLSDHSDHSDQSDQSVRGSYTVTGSDGEEPGFVYETADNLNTTDEQ